MYMYILYIYSNLKFKYVHSELYVYQTCNVIINLPFTISQFNLCPMYLICRKIYSLFNTTLYFVPVSENKARLVGNEKFIHIWFKFAGKKWIYYTKWFFFLQRHKLRSGSCVLKFCITKTRLFKISI